MGYSNQISANSTTAQALGTGIFTARMMVENVTSGLLPPAIFVLGVAAGTTPAAAAVVSGGIKIAVGDPPLTLEDPQYIDLATYFVATASGTADVRVTG